jgi:hypothetical protein
MIAKNLLNMPDVASRVTNAVFLNSAGVTDMHTRFPVFFRVKPVIDQAIQALQNWRKMIRMNYEKDNRQDANTPEYQFRSSVTVALQDGSHYRQPGWDTMSVNGGKIVLYVGGKDRLVGGREFASFIAPKIQNTSTSLEYDSNGHHGSPFTEPERVFDRLFSKHFPDRKVLV